MDIWKKSKNKASKEQRIEARKKKIKCQMKQKIEMQNREDAIEFIKRHNATNPEDRLILHGTYSRTIHVWCEQLGCMLDLKVKITRIRSKFQNRTFTFQGGTFIIRARYGGKFLLGMLARLAGHSGGSFDDICFKNGLPSRTARLYQKRLNVFLDRAGKTKMFESAAPEIVPDLFIRQLWYTIGNPFCSVMEAAR